MPSIPTIQTERLRLRAFDVSDASRLQELAGERDVAATTIRIPHPYPDGAAEEWIATHQARFDAGVVLPLAITLLEDASLIGAIGLEIDRDHDHAEMGYWIGVPYWKRGYATEAAAAVLDRAFATLELNRVHAHCMDGNPASGRVLEKIGMTREGCLRQHIRKWGELRDIVLYGCLRSEYDARRGDR